MQFAARLFDPGYATKRISRHAAWRLALLAGFVTQLLLIVFVTAIGLRQLGMTTDSLNQVVDVHMRKQNLTKTMVITARERSMLLLMLTQTADPFEHDVLLMQFGQNGSDFAAARLALLELPLDARERELIAQQGALTRTAVPIQNQVIELVGARRTQDAAERVLTQAIPAQDRVMATLSQLAAETQRVALAASLQAHDDHKVARFWMYLLSAAALVVGFVVAAYVFSFATRIGREREQIASHDALTGLPNRMLFIDRLQQALTRAGRQHTLVGVMFIDLDRFKRVNDTLGHAAGDQLICEVARRLRAAVRAEDIVARLGGDEFVVVISDVAAITAILQVAEKMLAVVTRPYQIAGHEIFSSCSIGVSVYPNDGRSAADLLRHADTAMYHAKGAGRNRFQLYDAAMNAMAEERLQLETDLHYALERNEFTFHYQPQVSVESGRILGVEALIRWNHPHKGVLAPEAFLEILEETGKIVDVGHALLTIACRQAASWHAAGFASLDVAVNVSSKEFWHACLVANVREALQKSGLRPQSLHLELSEGIFMEDIDAAVARIQTLKTLGVMVAVDDFGTGYSSLAHLKRFPVDILKIDSYFVRDLPRSPVSEALIGSILALARGLHLDAVAEGVETEQQLECLRRLGCRNVQGFVFSRPVPAEQLTQLLERSRAGDFSLA